jgi:hypothetical protein
MTARWYAIAFTAGLFLVVWLIINSGDPNCKRFETRTVETITEGKTGSRRAVREYKVCVEHSDEYMAR